MRNRIQLGITSLLSLLTLVVLYIIYTANTSALSFQNTADVEFTFNPFTSVAITGGDLSIASLTPGSSSDSNIITITAGGNSDSGYTLYTNVGDTTHNYTDLRLSASNTTNVFSTASASSLSALGDNKWGYSYSSNNGTTWGYGNTGTTTSTSGGYGAMPLFNTVNHNNDVKLADTTSASPISIQFKIGAKASSNQIAGEYTNIINFINVSKTVTIDYTLSYNANAGSDTVTNLPTSPVEGSVTSTTPVIKLSPITPTRTGYIFKGWCDTTTTDDTCAGKLTLPGRSYVVDTTNTTATISMYAVWVDSSYLNMSITFAGVGVDTVKVCTVSGDCSGTNLKGIASQSGDIIYGLTNGATYYLYPSFENGYILDSWSKTSSTGTLSSTTDTNPTFTMGTNNGAVVVSGVSSAITIASGGNMQNVSSKADGGCPDTLTTGQVYTLTDSRDGTPYKVARLADGNCWMLDNLALDPTSASVKANLTTDTTNATDRALQCLKTGKYNGTTCASPYSTAAVLNNNTSSFNSYYSQALVNTASKDTLVTSYGPAADSNGKAKVGVYYNYCAASAGSYCYAQDSGIDKANTAIDAESDICPKGWRMPTGGPISTTGNNAGGGEYQALKNQYNTTNTATDTASLQYNLSTPLSGTFISSSPTYQGSRGSFWSSTYYNGIFMYDLTVSSSSVNPQNNGGRNGGNSVRCLLQ